MTREEAIKVLRTESIELGGAAPSVCRFLEALDMAVKALVDVTDKDVGEWIRVEDRLPLELDPAPKVLFITKTGELFIGCYYKATAYDKFNGWHSMCVRIDNVTHWMPLPEPPEEVMV